MRLRAPLLGVVIGLLPACVSTKTAGRIVIDAGSASEAVLVPVRCYSGGREYFHGVDLVDPVSHAWVRVVVEPIAGPRVRIVETASEGRRESVLTPDQCRIMEVSVDPTSWRVNHVRDVSGHLRLDCRSASGQAVEADLSFSHCH